MPGAPEPQGARTVTLEVTAEQAERVQVAGRIGRLSLTVRAADQPASQDAPHRHAADLGRRRLPRPERRPARCRACSASTRAPLTARSSLLMPPCARRPARPCAGHRRRASSSRQARRAPPMRTRTVDIEVGSGRMITLAAPAANVFVADPKVAEVRPADRRHAVHLRRRAGAHHGRGTGCRRPCARAIIASSSMPPASPPNRRRGRAGGGAERPHRHPAAAEGTAVVSGEVATPEEAARVLSIAQRLPRRRPERWRISSASAPRCRSRCRSRSPRCRGR